MPDLDPAAAPIDFHTARAALFAGPRPTLRTERYTLRPFGPDDAPDVQRLANDRQIAANTLRVPHPYELDFARQWIGTHAEEWRDAIELRLAIVEPETDRLLGASGIHLTLDHHLGEVGYWVGRPYWGQGVASEVARRLVHFGFEELALHRVRGQCLRHNRASARVLENAGLRLEGTCRGEMCKWGEFHDVEIYGVLRTDLGYAPLDTGTAEIPSAANAPAETG